jgi:hypothetical protein
MTAVATEFIDFFHGFKKDENNEEVQQGIVNIVCGCMISKWNTVEFTRVFGIEKDYLQIAVIYIEPFTGYDYCLMYMDFDKVPECIMHLYHLALEYTSITEDEEQMTMYIPYSYNTSRRCIHKRCSVNHYNTMIGNTIIMEGSYINSDIELQNLENIFKNCV